jgi:hypothetical protein
MSRTPSRNKRARSRRRIIRGRPTCLKGMCSFVGRQWELSKRRRPPALTMPHNGVRIGLRLAVCGKYETVARALGYG